MHFNKLSSILLGSQIIIAAASYSYTRMDHKTMTGQFVMEIYVRRQQLSKFLQLRLSSSTLKFTYRGMKCQFHSRLLFCPFTFLSYNN